MKKYFFKEDGTIKLANMLIVITAIFIAFFAILFFKFFKTEVEEDYIPQKKSEKTSSISMCNDCDFSFILDTLTLSTYHDYKLTNYLDTKNLAINSIKFKVEDESLITVGSKGNDLAISTKNRVGHTKLIATYEKITKEIPITIIPDEIRTVELENHPYYIYNNQENALNIITDPLGIDISNLNISIADESIATIKNGKLLGLKEGSTTITLNFKDQVTSEKIYVFNDLINITAESKDKNPANIYKISLNEFKDDNFTIIVTLDDKENKGYSMEDLIISYDQNDLNVQTTYDGKYNFNKLSYKYRLTASGTEGKTIIKFTLGNTIRYLEIGD